jgi:hypothetical protein
MTGRPGLVAAAAAVLMLAVLTAGAAGPAPRDPPPQVAVDTAPLPAGSPTPSVRTTPPGQEQAGRFTVEVPVGELTVVGLGVVLALAAVLLVRLLRSRADDGPVRPVPAAPPSGPAAGPLDPGPLRGAVEDAVLGLARAGPTSSQDAVIACWLRLEEGAAAAGAARAPAQTPTEFTAAVLAAATGPGDAGVAVRELLGLYHQARFGSRPLDDGAGMRASAALERIRAGLAARDAGGPVGVGPAPGGAGR